MSENTTSDKVRERLEKIPVIQKILGEIAVAEVEREERRVDADPKANKNTRLMQDGKPHSFRYYEGQPDEHGRDVRFCYSCWRNRAGYFLTWREVWDPAKGEGFRDRWIGHKKRKAADAFVKRWAEQSRAGEL